ncbi:hypothetical protein VBY75_11875 [Idiomarina sp. HB]|uniref:hypothetical protein n=1 Tax=Idiomarina sp. HB TaxID=3110479 RepID=UPI003A7FAFAD
MRGYPFTQIITDVTSKFRKIKASDYKSEGRFKIIDQSQKDIAGYTDDSSLINRTHSPIIVFGDHTRALKYESSPIALGADGAKALSVNPKIANPLYVYYYLRSVNLKEAGYSRHFKFLKQVEIPIPEKDGEPDLNDQIRVAHLLGKVEGLIAQRKQHLKQLDDLLKSVFLEMFGDPVRNEKGWDTKTLPQLVQQGKNSLKRGPFGGALKKELFVETGYLVYEQNHALNNDYSFERYFVTEEKYQELIDFKVIPGDILISCSGVYLGKLSVVPDGARPGIINQALLKVSLDPKKIKHRFFVHIFGSPQFKRKYFPSSRGGAIPNLPPMSAMKEIPFICPPMKLQQDFTEIYEKVLTLKSRYQQSLNDLGSLYGALNQKAFKGELDLSQVPLPESEQAKNEVTTAVIEPEATSNTLAIHLPESDFLPDALTDKVKRKDLFAFWLESYCQQIGNAPFSANDFLTAAQTHIAELHPDTEFELDLYDYEQIKHWVFEALNSGRLQQAQNIIGQEENGETILGNRIELKVGVKP